MPFLAASDRRISRSTCKIASLLSRLRLCELSESPPHAFGVAESVLGRLYRSLCAAVRNRNLDRLANPVTFRNERERTSARNRIAPEAGKALAVGEAESNHGGRYS